MSFAIYEGITASIISEVELDGFYSLWALGIVFRTSVTIIKRSTIFSESIWRISLNMDSILKKHTYENLCSQKKTIG